MSKADKIIGELDPDQIKCDNCKEFKDKEEILKDGGFLTGSCAKCRAKVADSIRRSRLNKYGKEEYGDDK